MYVHIRLGDGVRDVWKRGMKTMQQSLCLGRGRYCSSEHTKYLVRLPRFGRRLVSFFLIDNVAFPPPMHNAKWSSDPESNGHPRLISSRQDSS